MKASLLALAIILSSSPPVGALDCISPVGSGSEVIKVTRSWFLRSPNKGTVAWSVVTQDMNLVSSKLIIRDERTKAEQTVGGARWDKDRVVGLDPDLSGRGDNFHLFCPIDWSPDGQRLLFGETIGPMDSDAGGTNYWIYERPSGSVHRINLDDLYKAVRIHWKMTEQNFGQELSVEGWRRHRAEFHGRVPRDVENSVGVLPAAVRSSKL